MSTIIAVDIGGTHMRAAAYTQDKLKPVKHKKIPTLASEPGGLNRLIRVIEDVWPKNDSVSAIGLGSPGPLDPHTGYLLAPPNNPEWHNFPLAPNVENHFGVKTYLDNWEMCLEVFGKNQVSTVAVAGIGEDDSSILKGVEMAASGGVLTFLVPHSPAAGAVYAGFQPPSADRMLGLYQKSVRIMQKHGLDLCDSAAGCIRGGGFSAIKDVARFGV